jgi:hypothetical protein
MIFLLPFLPAFAAALTVSIGEAVGIGASVFGIGAGIKGSINYHQAKNIQEAAQAGYHNMVARIRRRKKTVQKRLEDFGKLKLETYTGIIHEAAETLSRFKIIDLSSFKDIQVDYIKFFNQELDFFEKSFIKASDVLSCLSAGVNAAVHDTFPYKDTPPLFQFVGAFGIKTMPSFTLPNIPYSAITIAGLSWGISGDAALTRAEFTATEIARQTKKMKLILAGFNALITRITEGETLTTTLTGELGMVLESLQDARLSPDEAVSDFLAVNIETAITLTRTLKQVIEVDIVTGNGMLTMESGILFQKIAKEHLNHVG